MSVLDEQPPPKVSEEAQRRAQLRVCEHVIREHPDSPSRQLVEAHELCDALGLLP